MLRGPFSFSSTRVQGTLRDHSTRLEPMHTCMDKVPSESCWFLVCLTVVKHITTRCTGRTKHNYTSKGYLNYPSLQVVELEVDVHFDLNECAVVAFGFQRSWNKCNHTALKHSGMSGT